MHMYLDTTKFSNQILSRLNGIFMVRKIGQFLLSGGGGGGGGGGGDGGGGGGLVATPLSILPLSNFRDKMVAPIGKIFSWTDAPRMCIQPKVWFGIKALPIHERNWKTFWGVASLPIGHQRVTKLFSSYAQK